MVQEIKEGMKLIIEFMDCFEVNSDDQFRIKHIYALPDLSYGIYSGWKMWQSLNSCPFHSSWDWLMPVVEKIEKIQNIHVQIDYVSCRIFNFTDIIISKISKETKIENTFDAIVEFINWYNKKILNF